MYSRLYLYVCSLFRGGKTSNSFLWPCRVALWFYIDSLLRLHIEYIRFGLLFCASPFIEGMEWHVMLIEDSMHIWLIIWVTWFLCQYALGRCYFLRGYFSVSSAIKSSIVLRFCNINCSSQCMTIKANSNIICFTFYQAVKDGHLLLGVAALLFLDLVILIGWVIADPLHVESKQLQEKVCEQHANILNNDHTLL